MKSIMASVEELLEYAKANTGPNIKYDRSQTFIDSIDKILCDRQDFV